MSIVLITQRLEAISSYGEVREELDVNWAGVLKKAGHLMVAFPAFGNPRQYIEELRPSLIILSGGNDLSLIKNDETSRWRDKIEEELLKEAIDKSIPILGVCRGMEFISTFFGASLKKVEGHIAVRHRIKLNDNVEWSAMLHGLEEVNSFHKYIVADIPTDFEVIARSEDGYIEALICKKHSIYCQMWHPEREPYSSSIDPGLYGIINLRRGK